MIEKIRKLYPEYDIYIKKNNKIYDLDGKPINKNKIQKKYIVIIKNGYEVVKKI